ncbi:unnamed protein product [Ectocarpus sp. 6 AP-2014]
MMHQPWAAVVVAAGILATASAACDDVDNYLGIPNPLTGDMEIDLEGVSGVECAEIETDAGNEILLEQIVIDGGSVTLKSSSYVRFVNVEFDVKPGATLVFDMPETYFGPNTARKEGTWYYNSFGMNVDEGATVTFAGDVVASDVSNAFTAFYNRGSMEFQKTALFEDGTYVFYENQGTIKFRGDATFRNNRFHAIQNIFSGYIRFSKDVLFDGNSYENDNIGSCSLSCIDEESRIVVRGDAVFQNHNCPGVALWQLYGTTKFYGKAYFNNNSRDKTTFDYNMDGNLGGAVVVSGGTMTFNGAVQFNDNSAEAFGGGIGIEDGDVIFKKWTTFDGNSADNGAAFAMTGGTLTFQEPKVVTRFTNNDVYEDEYPVEESCTVGFVADEALVIGFPGDDICVAGGSTRKLL